MVTYKSKNAVLVQYTKMSAHIDFSIFERYNEIVKEEIQAPSLPARSCPRGKFEIPAAGYIRGGTPRSRRR